jgi:hypothetical protein
MKFHCNRNQRLFIRIMITITITGVWKFTIMITITIIHIFKLSITITIMAKFNS